MPYIVYQPSGYGSNPYGYPSQSARTSGANRGRFSSNAYLPQAFQGGNFIDLNGKKKREDNKTHHGPNGSYWTENRRAWRKGDDVYKTTERRHFDPRSGQQVIDQWLRINEGDGDSKTKHRRITVPPQRRQVAANSPNQRLNYCC